MASSLDGIAPPFDGASFQTLFAPDSSVAKLGEAQAPTIQPSSQFENSFPAAYRNADTLQPFTADHISSDLRVTRLNDIHDFLWLAGRPMPPRPLHYQLAASREIFLSEQIDMHLVWETKRIYVKPIPRYLLDHGFWKDHLVCKPSSQCECFRQKGGAAGGQFNTARQNGQSQNQLQIQHCPRRQSYEISVGFLLSYAALIQYESDFHIAQSAYLVPQEMKWRSWREFVRQLLNPKNAENINKRFRFGELRLGRLNAIYRLRFGQYRGYKFRIQTYKEFFEHGLASIISIIAFIGIVLTAMQVGLAVDPLKDSISFNRASYGFTVLSIVGPLVLILIVTIIFIVSFVSNLLGTMSYKTKRFATHDGLQVQA